MSPGSSSLSEKIKTLQQSVAETCRKAGRNPEEVKIVYVTKTIPVETIREAVLAGAQDLGENRVQDLQEKIGQLKEDQALHGLRWHMIGHLQTNKAKQVVGDVELIHSLDSVELAEAIEKQAQAKGIKQVSCLIQVNSSKEATKFGLNPEDVEHFVGRLKLSAIRLQGLMTIGPYTENEDLIRQAFRATRLLRDDLRRKFPAHSWNILSMGMSGDYKIAIEEGSTLIRVGTAVFGERKI